MRDLKKRLEWQTKRRHEWKRRIIDYKKKISGCQECGWNKHLEILEGHHVNKEEKEFSTSKGNIGSHSWEKILKELKKCKFLCPNCHRWLHYQEKDTFFNKKWREKNFKKKTK